MLGKGSIIALVIYLVVNMLFSLKMNVTKCSLLSTGLFLLETLYILYYFVHAGSQQHGARSKYKKNALRETAKRGKSTGNDWVLLKKKQITLEMLLLQDPCIGKSINYSQLMSCQKRYTGKHGISLKGLINVIKVSCRNKKCKFIL